MKGCESLYREVSLGLPSALIVVSDEIAVFNYNGLISLVKT